MNLHHDNNTDEIDNFVDSWNTAEIEFFDQDIEADWEELYAKMYSFIYKLAQSSGYIHTGSMLSAVPEAYRGAWGWPKHIDKRINELNGLRSECYNLNQKNCHAWTVKATMLK